MRKENIPCNYVLLKDRIRRTFGSQDKFADEIGISSVQINNKLNGRSDFTTQDVKNWCRYLSIDKEDIIAYFFGEEV